MHLSSWKYLISLVFLVFTYFKLISLLSFIKLCKCPQQLETPRFLRSAKTPAGEKEEQAYSFSLVPLTYPGTPTLTCLEISCRYHVQALSQNLGLIYSGVHFPFFFKDMRWSYEVLIKFYLGRREILSIISKTKIFDQCQNLCHTKQKKSGRVARREGIEGRGLGLKHFPWCCF